MKLVTGCLVLALLAVTSTADAWSWRFWQRNPKPRLPKPIDSPIVRPKQQAEKVKRQEHPARYHRAEWGQAWDKTLAIKHPHEGNHSIFRD